MNCKKIQELILTDYLDGQMNDNQKMRIKIHFIRCNQCNEFFEAARKVVAEPFVNAERLDPPEFIWSRIKEGIIAEHQRKTGLIANFLRKLKPIHYIPKPAFSIATVIALILIIGVMTKLRVNNQAALEVVPQGQIEYFTYSLDTPVSAFINDKTGFGTSIEEYFL